MNKYIVPVAVVALVATGFVGSYVFLQKPVGVTTTNVHALLVKYDKNQLLKESDIVVLAQVKDTQNLKSPSGIRIGKDDILTNVTLTVDKYLYNPKNSTSSEIIVQTLGGTVGNETMTVEDSTSFEKGQRVVVFLKQKDANTFIVSGWVQGKYTVGANGRLGVGTELIYLHDIFGRDFTTDEMETEIKK